VNPTVNCQLGESETSDDSQVNGDPDYPPGGGRSVHHGACLIVAIACGRPLGRNDDHFGGVWL
jgi:hypothetical protein